MRGCLPRGCGIDTGVASLSDRAAWGGDACCVLLSLIELPGGGRAAFPAPCSKLKNWGCPNFCCRTVSMRNGLSHCSVSAALKDVEPFILRTA